MGNFEEGTTPFVNKEDPIVKKFDENLRLTNDPKTPLKVFVSFQCLPKHFKTLNGLLYKY